MMPVSYQKLLWIVFTIILLLPFGQMIEAASPPQPTYGTAVVDGDISEWNLTNDFFANMYRAGNPSKQLEAKAYLRYDCDKHTLYVLVLTQPGVPALAQGWEAAAWGAIGTISNKVYTGNSGNPPTPPQFEWVGLSPDGLTAQGYEASFIINSGSPSSPAFYILLLHIEVFDSSASQTAATVGFPSTGVQLELICCITSIDIHKTYAWTTGDGSHVGDVVTYTYTVLNTGQVTLDPVTVVDDKMGPITLAATSLAPGASTTGTATLTLTQALLDAGSQTNTATATGIPPCEITVTDSDTKTVNFIETPSIEIVKNYEWTTGDGSQVGDVVTYTYTVTNTGNVTLNPVSATDDKLGTITLLATSLAPGASTTGTATLTLTQALLDAGSQTNIATATGTPPTGPNVTNSATKTVTFITKPSISIVKNFEWTTGDGSHVGDVVTYTYTVTNTGNVTLNPVSATDDKLGTITLLATSLAPGASTTGTATLTLTQALLDAGSQTNIATATGTPPSGPNVTNSATKTVTFIETPSIEIVKNYEWTTGNGSQVGDVVTYTYTVTNTGNVTLNPVSVNDDKLGAITLLATSLAPGASTTGTATLTLTQALLDAGSQTNIATATGTPPTGPNVTNSATKTVTFITTPSIHILKSFAWTSGDGTHVGDVVTYTYTVTNTGNVTLNPVSVTDDKLGAITLLATSLAPGATTTGTKSLTLTQELLDDGSQTNIATATGTPPTGPNVSDTASQTVVFGGGASIDLQKTYAWTTGDGSAVGDVVTYTYTVKNTGSVTLDPVEVTDDVLGDITLGSTSLASGATTTGTATLTLTQDLLDAGSQTNIATATGTPPSGPDVTDVDTQTVVFLTSPAIKLVKTFEWTTGNGSAVGDVVTYTYTVTNTGNVTLDPVSVTDDKLGPITLLATSLAPGEETTGTATLTLTQALLDAGSQTNTGTATGTPEHGGDVTSTSTRTVTFLTTPAIKVVKTFEWTTGDGSQVGDVVTYTYTVTNTGNEDLDPVSVSDDKLGPITLSDTSLAPGEETTGTATLTLTQALLNEGSQTNTATATGKPPTGDNVTDISIRTVTFQTTPAILVVKTFEWTTGNGSAVGDVVTFTYTVTNTGNVTLDPVSVDDDKLGPITLADTSLDPGEQTTGTATLTLTQDILDNGSQTNTATATGKPPTGDDVTDTSTRTVTFLTTPAINIQKHYVWTTGDGSALGDVVTYTYLVTNTGNVTLDPVTVVDDKLGSITLLATSLAPGASTTGTATLTLTQPLLDAGQQINIATATGTPKVGSNATETASQTVQFTQITQIALIKYVSVDGGVTWLDADVPPGPAATEHQTVYFKYDITNIGNVTLTDVTLVDDKHGTIVLSKTTLSPLESVTAYSSTIAEDGLQTDIATATGTPPQGAVAQTTNAANYYGTEPWNEILQAYESYTILPSYRGYKGLGVNIRAALPGVFAIGPGENWSNFIKAAQDGVDYTLKNVTLTKTSPDIVQCSDIFPAKTIIQQGTPNIRLWWPLMYEAPETTWTLKILYGTNTLYDHDGNGPDKPAYVHEEEWTWIVETEVNHLKDLINLFHQLPFGKDEVPLISDEILYSSLQEILDEVQEAIDAGNTATAADLLSDFEMMVMDACIGFSPTHPNPTGVGTGIANSEENPACCKLLADAEFIGRELGVFIPGK